MTQTYEHPKVNALAIFGLLIALTGVEVAAVTSIEMPKSALMVTLLVTLLLKTFLVALYFMHLKFEGMLIWGMVIGSFVIGTVFVLILFPDLVIGYWK